MNIIEAIKSGKRFRIITQSMYICDQNKDKWFESCDAMLFVIQSGMRFKDFINLEVEVEEPQEEKRELTRSQIIKALWNSSGNKNELLKELGFTVED